MYGPFAQERSKLSDSTKGTGLGLPIVKNLSDAKVLLVEDNDINIYVAKIILERVGCQVTIAKIGQEAIDVFSTSELNYFDAILMDVRMPVMDGITATKAIRLCCTTRLRLMTFLITQD